VKDGDKGNSAPNLETKGSEAVYVPSKPIVLVGLMGAGKSAIGRRLAQRLDLPFIDADQEIEAAAGCSIDTIFEVHGEAAFRDCERRVLARLLESTRGVVATGGGAFIDPETRARVRERAISVWLRAQLDLLVERVARRNNRPLLKRGNPREILQKLMDERYPIYALADVTVDTGDAPPETTVSAALAALMHFDRSENRHRAGLDGART
jgi:shikimate kinase